MKKILYSFLVVLISIAVSCSDDDESKNIPKVSTGSVTMITTSSAKVSGTISNNGNAEVLEAGFVYSSTVAEPTTADNKLKVNTAAGDYTVTLEGLTSGTVYRVRAYAINSIGTAYGEIVSFTSGNAAPLVENLTIVGKLEVGQEVMADYEYIDYEDDEEGVTTYQWYMADDATGTGASVIEGVTGGSLIIRDYLDGKFLRVGVTPHALTGTLAGDEILSSFVGAIGDATTVTFTYDGDDVTYGIITATSGKKWMDRNLGAGRAAQSVDDYQAYGDLFQWGRLADGHQIMLRTSGSAGDMAGKTGTTSDASPYETSDFDVPVTDKFIIDGSLNGDWRSSPNNALWQGVDGVNNPCPEGWRLPTKDEWEAESIESSADAYSKLKLTYNGFRSVSDGSIVAADGGLYWSSTIQEEYAPQLFSYLLYFSGSSALMDFSNRGNGLACRCVKE